MALLSFKSNFLMLTKSEHHVQFALKKAREETRINTTAVIGKLSIFGGTFIHGKAVIKQELITGQPQ